jgi:hypothetical protein
MDFVRLITFNNSSPSPPRVKRQATTPQVYNVTQNFAATAGSSYTLSAYAAQAQNGGTAPACSITICGDSTCGPSTALTSQYAQYSYQFNAGVTESGAVGTFSISCPQSAYVALDNVTVTTGSAAAVSVAPVTTTIVQYVTRTQSTQGVTQTQTQSVQGATQTETTQQIGTPLTQIFSVTNTISTVLWSTATDVVSIAQTEYLSVNITVSELSTTTSEFSIILHTPVTRDVLTYRSDHHANIRAYYHAQPASISGS